MSRFQKTCTTFDGKAGGSIMIQGNAIPAPTMLTLSLLERVCRSIEKNDQKGTRLFKAICANLTEKNHLDVNAALDDCTGILRKFGDNFVIFLKKLRSDLLMLPAGELPELKLPLGTNFLFSPVCYINRYKHSFDELEMIAEGGFGIVCKARNRVDGAIYAVKKIPFRYTNELEFKTIIREARSFATLKHKNIVRYNNAWLDNYIGSDLTSLSDSSSNSGSIEYDKSRSVSGENDINKRSVSKSSWESFHSSDRIMFVDEAEHTSVSNVAYRFAEHLKHTAGPSTITAVTESSYTGSNEVVSYSSSVSDYNFGSAQTRRTTNVVDNFNITTKDSLTKRHRHNKYFKSPDESSSSNSETGVALNNNIVGETISHGHGSSATCSFDSSSSVADQNPDLSDGPVNKCSVSPDSSDSNALVQLLPSFENAKLDLSNLNIKVVLYIQMEYCDSDLYTWLREKAKDSNCDKLNPMKIFKQIVSGVQYIHSKSIIHRDLKPKNIFLFKKTGQGEGQVKIGDFGLATLPHHTDDGQGNKRNGHFTRGLGTVPYAAPEQRKYTKYDCKVDIYSLGIILFEILHPVSTMAELINLLEKILKGEFPSQFEALPDHVNLIKRLLETDSGKRPSATEILELPIMKEKTESIEEIKSRIVNLSKDEQIEYLLNCLIEKNKENAELNELLKRN